MRVIESIVKVDVVLGEGKNEGQTLIDIIQDYDLEGHNVAQDSDDSDVLIFTRYYEN